MCDGVIRLPPIRECRKVIYEFFLTLGKAVGNCHQETVVTNSNRFVGWLSLTVGAGTGLILGLWSFDGPLDVHAWIGEYGDTSRRLVRLGHIAFFGLGILNILLARELPRLADTARRIASPAMNFGNVVLPITLLAAVAYHPFKYFLPIPALSVFLALLAAAFGLRDSRD